MKLKGYIDNSILSLNAYNSKTHFLIKVTGLLSFRDWLRNRFEIFIYLDMGVRKCFEVI